MSCCWSDPWILCIQKIYAYFWKSTKYSRRHWTIRMLPILSCLTRQSPKAEQKNRETKNKKQIIDAEWDILHGIHCTCISYSQILSYHNKIRAFIHSFSKSFAWSVTSNVCVYVCLCVFFFHWKTRQSHHKSIYCMRSYCAYFWQGKIQDVLSSIIVIQTRDGWTRRQIIDNARNNKRESKCGKKIECLP